MASDSKAKTTEARRIRRTVRAFRSARLFVRVHARVWFVMLLVIVGAAASTLYIAHTPKRYRASAQIFVTTKQATVGALAAGETFVQSQMQSYASIVTSSLVIAPVEQRLDLGGRGLAGEVSADAPLDQVLLNVHVQDSSASRAAAIANAVAEQTIVVITRLQSSAVELTVIHSAVAPSGPVSPREKLDLAIGALGGLLIGLALVIGRERIAPRIRSRRDVEVTTKVPVLGTIPDSGSSRSDAVISSGGSPNARSEAFSQLRTSLQFVNVDDPPKVLAVTSGNLGDGATSVAINVALDLAAVGFRVCLVEADLRRPTLARILSISNKSGLTSILTGQVGAGPSEGAQGSSEAGDSNAASPVASVMRVVGKNELSVLTSGPLPPNPGNLLASKQFRSVISELRQDFEYVILDTASLLSVVDGPEALVVADAALVVVRARVTTRHQLMATLRAIELVDGSAVGIVIYRALRLFPDGSRRPARRSRRTRGGAERQWSAI
jgi:Mrp family chromosome partitioning ATPase